MLDSVTAAQETIGLSAVGVPRQFEVGLVPVFSYRPAHT